MISTKGTPADRIAAIQELVRSVTDANLDEVLEMLRRHTVHEHDTDVAKVLFGAKRNLTLERGRKRGLRGPRPTELDTDDEDLTFHAVRVAWDAIDIYGGNATFEAALALATLPQQALYAAWMTISEARYGGFRQFFQSWNGIVAPHARDGMRFLGVPAAADLMTKAMAPFAGVDISDVASRVTVLETLDDTYFREIDGAFYEQCATIFEAAAAYVRAHPDDFFEP